MAQVRLRDVVKTYGPFKAVDHVSLTIEDGEFVALVGPSGCGKTTTLNLVAGLIEITGGEIHIGDRQVNDLDPKDRDILERSKLLEQQRVALGRALVRDPKVFLMDEPLSNLDAKLRVQMRSELKRFHQDLNATVIYVTHDQLEAVTMADKMAVMNGGVLQQYDRPEVVFETPVNTFVAGFVGSPAMNLVKAEASYAGDDTFLQNAAGWRFKLSARNAARTRAAGSKSVIFGARHSTIRLTDEASVLTIPGLVYTVEPTGDVTFVHVKIGEETIVVSVPPTVRLAPNQTVQVLFDQDKLHLFDGDTGMALPPG